MGISCHIKEEKTNDLPYLKLVFDVYVPPPKGPQGRQKPRGFIAIELIIQIQT